MFKPLRDIPAPILILLLSFLCPTEFSLMVGTFRLSPHRVVLLVLAPIAFYRVLVRRDIEVKSFDFVMLLFALSSVGVFMQHLGAADGVKFGGSLALESFGAYIAARAYIRTAQDFEVTVKVLLMMVIAAGLIALPETLLGKLYVHDTLRTLTGYAHPTTLEQRLGLTRAYGTFDHPIHFGTFTASVLAMLWFTEKSAVAQRMKAALIGFVTFLGLSSAPILCLGVQGGFIVWERITRGMKSRVTLLVIAVVTLYVIADAIMTRSPFAFIATGLTIDSWTGYYRLQIWEHGMNNVWANPWLGIGLNDWERPWWMIADTVDAFWLVLMMRQGIPSALLLVLTIALLIWQANKNSISKAGDELRQPGMGWLISLIAMMMVAVTVHYWNVLFTYFCFILGVGGVFADPLRQKFGARADNEAKATSKAADTDIWAPVGPGLAVPRDNIWGAPASGNGVPIQVTPSNNIWARP